MKSQEYTESFFLSAGETNAESEISLPLLTSKIIDISTTHANMLGIGNPAMAHLHCGWVLSRIAIEMKDYPKVNETYHLTTWVESWNRHFSERCYEISNDAGESLGFARSIWMVLDTESRESVGLDHLSISEDMMSKKECPIGRGKRHAVVLEAGYQGAPVRNSLIAPSKGSEYEFKYCDLDYYRHVNTVRYVGLLLNQFTLEEMDSQRVKRIEMAFMHEGKYGMRVEVRRADQEDTSNFMLIDTSTSTPILSALIELEPRSNL